MNISRKLIFNLEKYISKIIFLTIWSNYIEMCAKNKVSCKKTKGVQKMCKKIKFLEFKKSIRHESNINV